MKISITPPWFACAQTAEQTNHAPPSPASLPRQVRALPSARRLHPLAALRPHLSRPAVPWPYDMTLSFGEAKSIIATARCRGGQAHAAAITLLGICRPHMAAQKAIDVFWHHYLDQGLPMGQADTIRRASSLIGRRDLLVENNALVTSISIRLDTANQEIAHLQRTIEDEEETQTLSEGQLQNKRRELDHLENFSQANQLALTHPAVHPDAIAAVARLESYCKIIARTHLRGPSAAHVEATSLLSWEPTEVQRTGTYIALHVLNGTVRDHALLAAIARNQSASSRT